MPAPALALAAAALVLAQSPKLAVRMEADGAVVMRALAAPLPTAVASSFDHLSPDARWGIAVWLKPGADPAPVLEALVQAGAAPVAVTLRPEGARLLVTAREGAGPQALAIAHGNAVVVAVTPWGVPVTLNDDSIWVGQSYDTVGKTTPVFDHGVTGTGEVVAVYDTGLDPDMCYFTLAAKAWNQAQALVPPDTGIVDTTKKTWAYYVEPGATSYDYDGGHGTAVSGCVLGDNWATPSTPTTAGHDPGDGMAPNARLLMLDGGAGGWLTGIVGDLSPIFLQAYNAGARIQNHSWGSPGINLYTPDSADEDRFMWKHEDMLFVNAAGNSGGGPAAASVIPPSVSKSSLAVGATTNGDVLAQDLAGFSSRGPTFDGRIKPDIVGPGVANRTAYGSSVQDDDNCGIGRPSGTSFASPTTAGYAALARQYHRDGFLPSGVKTAADATLPSAALLKATLIASAVPLEGNDPNTGLPVPPPPSMSQGWGRTLLDNALYFAGDTRRTTVLDLRNPRGLKKGDQATLTLNVAGPAQPLEVVLVWTDPPTSPAANPILVNDLDLVVTDPGGKSYLGNVWTVGESTTGGSADLKNPVEAVRIQAPVAGAWTVRVDASKIAGIPGMYGSDRQGFALVATYPACAAATPTAPSAPTLADQAGGIRVNWTAVAGAAGYLVYRADAAAAPQPADHLLLTPVPIAGSTYTDAEVQCSTAYSYVVRAWNGCALGAASPAKVITRARPGCTLPPDFDGISDARPDGTCGNVAISWSPAVSRCSCSTGVVYNVWASPVAPIDPTVTAPVATCVSGTSLKLALGAGAGLTHFLVRAEDKVAGGTGRCGGVEDWNLATLASVPTSPTRAVAFRDGFDAGVANWQHGAIANVSDPWDIIAEPFAVSSPNALVGLDLNWASDAVAVLVPPIRPTSDTLVGFRHTFEFEGRFDGGVVEISGDGGVTWNDAGARLVAGRYTDWMMTGASNNIIRPGFTSGTLGPMQESLLWLGDLAGRTIQLRFRILSDGSGKRERWAIDDFTVFDRDCPASPGAVVAGFTASTPVCDGDPVSFDASGSYGGSPPYVFTWDFGDGPPAVGPARTTHLYAAPGSYIVKLTASDALSASDTTFNPVEVVADVTAPDLNTLTATKRGADVALAWSVPLQPWPGYEVLAASVKDLSDLAQVLWIPRGGPLSYTRTNGVNEAPQVRFFHIRLRSTCRGTPGPV